MMRKALALLPFLLALCAAFAGYLAYPYLPSEMVSHWNTEGEPNGTMSRFWGAALMPLMMFGLAALFAVIPKIDPLKSNLAKSRAVYDSTVSVVMIFLSAIYAMSLLWNLGYRFPFASLMMILLGGFFMALGVLMPRMKRNWFMGIRTPWTLSSDTVWDKTHELGGSVFVLAGLAFVIAGARFPDALLAVGFAALAGTLFLVLYSYLEFRKERG